MTEVRPMWVTGQPMTEDDWASVTEICSAALDWAAARQAVLQEETPDVRRSDSFRERLEALATAEQRLVAATARKEGQWPISH